MRKLKVGLRPIARNINLPTVIKTAVIPGDSMERLFIATQVGEIFYIGDSGLRLFLDIRPRIIKLGASRGGYDERGLLGLAFHPEFYYNGLFYLHYSAAGTQGPGALPDSFQPNPCDPPSLNLRWTNRETQFDHIDTVEEWVHLPNGEPRKRRTLLHLRRPFFNHNGVNSLTFSPETGRLVLTTGDGGSGFDPFNLSQDNLEIAGKIIEIDVRKNPSNGDPPIVTRFDELPSAIQATLTVIAKGVRNIPGISYQRFHNQFIKYAGNVGQELIESIFSFTHYQPVPVPLLAQASSMNTKGLINFGWRGWEGGLPALVPRACTENQALDEKIMAFYQEAVSLASCRLHPLTSYYHQDARAGKFAGTALTGVQAYMGRNIPGLTGSVVFTDFARKYSKPVRGALAYTSVKPNGKQNDFHEIQIDYEFGNQPAHFVSLGTDLNQTRLFLGVYGSARVTDLNQGGVFEILP
ncbi:glucose dehydrogenase [Mesobacillus campisalis]|uniref:Glucose dehydrogenase n=1 Tax=Mesobacillus campisalis TaxID=1408103 RepID=A0A0M2SY14_9BACI|nr:PQQ-dependent sugar dehydrogenase [Mesobacillus campisalis]KKK39068.1 glucose dehydrogenase [Mesobacillus campisalis]